MKRTTLILFLVFFLSALTVYSQEKEVKVLDSIDHIKDDSTALAQLKVMVTRPNLSIRSLLNVKLQMLNRYIFLQQFYKAMLTGNEGLLLAQRSKMDSLEALFDRALGNINYYLEQKNKAIEYYKKAAAIAHKFHYGILEATCLNNIGASFIDMNRNNLAEPYLLESIGIFMKENSNAHEPVPFMTYRVLATLYAATNRKAEAEAIYIKLIKIARETKDTTLLFDNLSFYSNILRERGEFEKAISLSNEALQLMRKTAHYHNLLAGMIFHAQNLSAGGKDREAYQLESEAYTLQQKSFKKDLDKQLGEMEVKYKTSEILNEKELLQIKANRQLLISLFSIAGILLLGGFIFIIVNLRKNSIQKLALKQQHLKSFIDGEEKERSRIAKDLHDGIVQNLTAIQLKLNQEILAGEGSSNSTLHELAAQIGQSAKEVREISYQMMPLSLKELGLIPALKDLLQKMLTPYNISCDFETIRIEGRLPDKIEVCLYRITQELLNNVIKHSEAVSVSLLISKNGNLISMIFEDNGKGFNKTEHFSGMGMISLKSRLDSVEGDLKFETLEGKGTAVYIKIPVT